MPEIPVNSPLSYIGVFLSIVGFFLVLAGLGIITVKQVTVKPGRKTWGIGIIMALFGLAFLLPDIYGSLPQPVTPTSTVIAAASSPTPMPTLTTTSLPSTTTPTETPPVPPASVQLTLSSTRTPATTQIPLLGEILFQEEFESNQNDWFIGGDTNEYVVSNYQITNDGKYRISITSRQNGVDASANIPKLSVENFLLTFDATMVEPSDVFTDVTSPAIRIGFRIKDSNNFYVVYISDDASKVSVKSGGEWTIVRDWKNEKDIFIQKGVTRSFSLLVEDSTFVLSMEGKKLAVIDDRTISGSGEIRLGVVLWFENQVATFEFDNIVVKRIL